MNLRKRKLEDVPTSCEKPTEVTSGKKDANSNKKKDGKKDLSAKAKGKTMPTNVKPHKKTEKTDLFNIVEPNDQNIEQTKLPRSKFEKSKKIKSESVSGKSDMSTSSNSSMPAIKLEKMKELKSENTSKAGKASKKKNDIQVSRPSKYENLGAGPPAVPFTGKMYVGCHVSAAGGVWNSFENGRMSNATSIAMFLRNQRSWNAKPLDADTIQKWKEASKGFPPHLILPHGSYLMNLGSPNQETLKKSRDLFIEELQRCEKLGIPHFNFHPGSSLGEISREECCNVIAESINLAHKKTSSVICVIENMSKQGFTVGGDLHEIRLIIEGVVDRSRVGVCIDTCHAHAAGYDLATTKGFEELVTDFEKIIGWQFLRALHLNDSKGKAGDHKDRHEVIGKGYIGKEGFQRVMNYPRFRDIPLILETPFVSEDHYAKEINLLQKMVK